MAVIGYWIYTNSDHFNYVINDEFHWIIALFKEAIIFFIDIKFMNVIVIPIVIINFTAVTKENR